MSATDRNERRIARMSTWISHAKATSGEEEAHVRFLFYWIAYEAAYHMNETGESEGGHGKERRKFHRRLASHDRVGLQSVLRVQKKDVEGILELRQAHPYFWRKVPKKAQKEDSLFVVKTACAWETDFKKWVESVRKRLNKAVRNQKRLNDEVWFQKYIVETLNDLFENLSIVRHQIVHGGSAGPDSRGRTQVIRGARLLSVFVPCFHEVIKNSIKDEDWGEPPFPRVGSGRDDKCPPPWLS